MGCQTYFLCCWVPVSMPQILQIDVTLYLLNPDMGLFATDVSTDWINGVNLIQEGHLMWGCLMLLATFLPVAIGSAMFFISEAGWWGFFVYLVVFVPVVAIGTPLYIILTFLTHCIRLVCEEGVHPVDDFDDDHDHVGCCGCDNILRETGPMFIMAEIVGEACPQSILGNDFFLTAE